MTSAGRILIMPKGDYNAETTYETLDLVYHAGRSWLAKKTVVGIEPSAANSEYWHNMFDFDPGSTDISTIGDGSVHGAIKYLSENKISDLAKYYVVESNQSADDLLDSFALIPISTTINSELHSIFSGSFAWVLTLFYNVKSSTTRRVQVAMSYNSLPTKMAIRAYGADGFDAWRKIQTNDVSSKEISGITLIDKVKIKRNGGICQIYLGSTTQEIPANTTTKIATLTLEYRPSTAIEGMVSVGNESTTLPMYVKINEAGELSIRATETIPSGIPLYGIFTYIM